MHQFQHQAPDSGTGFNDQVQSIGHQVQALDRWPLALAVSIGHWH